MTAQAGVPARRARRLAAFVPAFAALPQLRFAIAAGAFRNSDDASNLLAGAAVADGNWQLHGWIMAPDNYSPTDVLTQSVLYLLFGFHPVLMKGAEAAIWALVALAGLGSALRDAQPLHLPRSPCRCWSSTSSTTISATAS